MFKMSVDGSSSGKGSKTYFCDLDGVKKKELERRRKLRLGQVRMQSKEISSQIRERVAREKNRQLRNIEEIKKRELLSWKEQHVNKTMADYHNCLSNLGDAHAAAERENRLKEHFDKQQLENRRIAAIRGRKALQKERLKNAKKNERIIKQKAVARPVDKNVAPASPQVCDEEVEIIISDDDESEPPKSDGKFMVTNLNHLFGNRTTSPEKSSKLEEKREDVRLSRASDLIEERRRARNQMLELFQAASELENLTQSADQCSELPQEEPIPAVKPPKCAPKAPEVRMDFPPKTLQSARIDKVTSNNRPQTTTATIKNANTPNKGVKSKNIAVSKSSEAAPKFSSPKRREFVPRFTKNSISKPGILKNKNVPVTAATDATASTDKVQYYDHFSRYGKAYDSVPGMVVRESEVQYINANEAARLQNEMDEVRFQQLEQLRQKSEQRCKESLQKNQIRKDYENLAKELDELCREENRLRGFAMPNDQFCEERITQMAQNRQRNMNRAFEEIYSKPVVITCPPTGSNVSSPDVNVATSLSSDKQKVDPLDSSDSCTSILLGYVDNRSRKLVKDITQCKDSTDGDKRKKLAELLTRLDQLRKVLMDEIVRNSSLNLEPFYRSVLQVETEKKEILCDSDADKENSDLKNKRNAPDFRLERKVAELFVKEHSKPHESAEDNTLESVNSETMNSAVDQSDAVKILIEVKNAAKVRKSRSSKNVGVVSHVNVPKTQNKTSVGSSASTAYRSPPQTLQTDFTKVLSNQATVKASAKSKTLPQKPLAEYINRLLGMSQKSIDELGISSSSSIATPSASIVEVPANVPQVIIDRNHLNRVQEKIDENIRFSREVDDSFKVLQTRTETETVTNKNQQDTKFVKKSQLKKQEKISSQIQSNLQEKSKKLTRKIKPKALLPSEDSAPPTIPENSQRIIDDLSKRIAQLRQDKQKMLEKNLSSEHSGHSSSGKDFDATEYRDFASSSKSKSKEPIDENVYSSHTSDILSEEEPKNLINTKQVGISFSRDSGIGSSRPVTSTDFRVSPDIKLTDKSTAPQVLKVTCDDTTKINDRPSGHVEIIEKLDDGAFRKPSKPPISLKRYSPQLNQEPLQPHDLSTINEVETSAASRANQTTHNETSDSLGQVVYSKFPTFKEYVKSHEIGSVASSESEKSISDTILKKMLEVTCVSETDLNYRKLDRFSPKNKTCEKSTNTEPDSERVDRDKGPAVAGSNLSTLTDSIILSSLTSNDKLAKDFKQIGLDWASAMLKKTSTAQNLESSSSSIASVPPTAVKNQSVNSSSDDRINGNPLNIREFLARELLKRSQLSSSSSISDSSTLTDQFLKSLFSTSSSIPHQGTTIRTSTPNRNLSTESEKFVVALDVGHTARDDHLFSGDSLLSSVRGVSHSETSGPKTSD